MLASSAQRPQQLKLNLKNIYVTETATPFDILWGPESHEIYCLRDERFETVHYTSTPRFF
jgi:hypothetical protein